MENNWKDTLKITENMEQKRILDLQRKIKSGQLQEEDLNSEDVKKVRMLYYKQNEKLRDELIKSKNRIKKLLNK